MEKKSYSVQERYSKIRKSTGNFPQKIHFRAKKQLVLPPQRHTILAEKTSSRRFFIPESEANQNQS